VTGTLRWRRACREAAAVDPVSRRGAARRWVRAMASSGAPPLPRDGARWGRQRSWARGGAAGARTEEVGGDTSFGGGDFAARIWVFRRFRDSDNCHLQV
jgi:hypothetical protein